MFDVPGFRFCDVNAVSMVPLFTVIASAAKLLLKNLHGINDKTT